ncbi:MAG: glycosyltransferase family 4 protein [Tissierellia bacterium]|nr:glycosyltransferase family 4 protein [Tissierellia bacterium]
MKLLFFIGSMRGGGAERVMAVLTDELAKRGHDVTLVVMSSYPSFYKLNKDIKLIQFNDRVNNRFFGKIKYKLKSYIFIRQNIKKLNPDVVISFMLSLNAMVLISSIFLKEPIIVSEHSTFDIKLPLKKRFQRFYLNKLADRVTVLTFHDYNFIGTRLKNKIVMPNPLSFVPLAKYNEDRKKNIIAAGSIDRFHGKGFDSLIKIWGKIANKYPEWKLLIAGGGNDENIRKLRELANEYNVNSQFELLGQVKNLDERFRESSIFVLSSRYEGFGMVLIEAMSQGCACISFDCTAGPREIINNNVDGILVEDQNMDAMTLALSDLIENEDKRERLATEAIKSVDRFSVKNIADKWERLFADLVEIKP